MVQVLSLLRGIIGVTDAGGQLKDLYKITSDSPGCPFPDKGKVKNWIIERVIEGEDSPLKAMLQCQGHLKKYLELENCHGKDPDEVFNGPYTMYQKKDNFLKFRTSVMSKYIRNPVDKLMRMYDEHHAVTHTLNPKRTLNRKSEGKGKLTKKGKGKGAQKLLNWTLGGGLGIEDPREVADETMNDMAASLVLSLSKGDDEGYHKAYRSYQCFKQYNEEVLGSTHSTEVDHKSKKIVVEKAAKEAGELYFTNESFESILLSEECLATLNLGVGNIKVIMCITSKLDMYLKLFAIMRPKKIKPILVLLHDDEKVGRRVFNILKIGGDIYEDYEVEFTEITYGDYGANDEDNVGPETHVLGIYKPFSFEHDKNKKRKHHSELEMEHVSELDMEPKLEMEHDSELEMEPKLMEPKLEMEHVSELVKRIHPIGMRNEAQNYTHAMNQAAIEEVYSKVEINTLESGDIVLEIGCGALPLLAYAVADPRSQHVVVANDIGDVIKGVLDEVKKHNFSAINVTVNVQNNVQHLTIHKNTFN